MHSDAAAMEIQINGEPRTVRADSTLPELLDALQLPAQAVLVEHNGVALFRHDWPTIQLAAGDRLEIIRIVAGG
ncbi:MAG: sulfur carrier protein ThiS [Verrucomicrobia bacterium]|nr:sulfur carrier protein ThiS [Verrucomicrobiota bacterium]